MDNQEFLYITNEGQKPKVSGEPGATSPTEKIPRAKSVWSRTNTLVSYDTTDVTVPIRAMLQEI
jgi:hypothetical protein